MKNEKLERVRKLRGIMLGLEMNLNLLEQDLDVVNKELCHLVQIEDDLKYNINLHKSGKVISVVKEYKRSIDELEIIRKEIIKYRNHRDSLEKKLEKKLKSYDYYLNEFEKAYDDLNSEAVILLFRKGKDGKEK